MSMGRNIASIFNMWNGVKSNDPLLKKEKKTMLGNSNLKLNVGLKV